MIRLKWRGNLKHCVYVWLNVNRKLVFINPAGNSLSFIQLSYSKSAAENFKRNLDLTQRILYYGAVLKEPCCVLTPICIHQEGRQQSKLTSGGRCCHTQEQNQRTNRMFAAIIKHRLTFWRKKSLILPIPCLFSSVCPQKFRTRYSNCETGRRYQYAWVKLLYFPSSFMPVSANLMDLQFVMRLELMIKQ